MKTKFGELKLEKILCSLIKSNRMNQRFICDFCKANGIDENELFRNIEFGGKYELEENFRQHYIG